MQNAVMGPPERKLAQHRIRIADEIPIGEEQKFDDVPDRLSRPRLPRSGRRRPVSRDRRAGSQIYVSHIDLFSFYCYKNSRTDERIVPELPAGASLRHLS